MSCIHQCKWTNPVQPRIANSFLFNITETEKMLGEEMENKLNDFMNTKKQFLQMKPDNKERIESMHFDGLFLTWRWGTHEVANKNESKKIQLRPFLSEHAFSNVCNSVPFSFSK